MLKLLVSLPSQRPGIWGRKYIGSPAEYKRGSNLYKTDNIVFSADDLPMQRILDLMIHPDKEVRYLITGGNASAVIGKR